MDLPVLESMPDAVLIVASDGRIEFVNRAAEALFGYERSELLGRPVEILIPSRFRAEHWNHVRSYVEAPRVRPMGLGLDLRALAKDGHELSVEISLAPLALGPEGCTIAAVRDVTERKLLEERARAAERMAQEIRHRDEVLAVASHELRGPAGFVELQAHMLQRAAAETIQDLNVMHERMRKIERNAGHLARLVEDLLDMSQLEHGAMQLKVQDMDLAERTRDTVDRLRDAVVERAGARVTFSAEGPVRGRWDPVRVDQIVTNLVANAAKFGQGKPIAVSVEGEADRARIIVTDQGIGIAAADQQRIFERFEKAAPPHESYTKGLGLGLYIVRQIVRAHGGRVLVSSAVGSGSTFTVELPRTGAGPQAA